MINHYGLAREFYRAGYFETEHHKEFFKKLKAAIKLGKLIAFSGIVGFGRSIECAVDRNPSIFAWSIDAGKKPRTAKSNAC